MQALVILGHPRPDSLNAALAKAAAEELASLGHQVTLRDLCAEGFDPALTGPEEARGAHLPPQVAEHCDLLARAQALVVVHPNWWGMPPAVLKGWIDRVFRPGLAYEFVEGDDGQGVPQPLLTELRHFVVINTSNTFAARERMVFGDPLERIWRDCVCGLCSRAEFTRRVFGVVCMASAGQRAAWLVEARDLMRRVVGAA